MLIHLYKGYLTVGIYNNLSTPVLDTSSLILEQKTVLKY